MSLFRTDTPSELHRFWREMAPVPGRMAASLRFALTSALATLLLLILQPPAIFIAPALFMLFLISHDAPYRCFQDLVILLSSAVVGTAAVLLLVIATGNHPVARVAGLGVFTFLAAFFFRTSAVPAFPMGFGCITYMVISLWEYQVRAETVLHLSLWPLGVLATVAGSAVAVEYLFNRSDPVDVLRNELKARCDAMERLLQMQAAGASSETIHAQLAVVHRYVVTGEGQLHVQFDRAARSGKRSDEEMRRLKAVTLILDRLLVLAVGLASCRDTESPDPIRLARIGRALNAAGEGRLADIHEILGDGPVEGHHEIDRIERTLRHLGGLADPSVMESPDSAPQAADPGGSWKASLRRLMLPDAFSNDDYFLYALKLSLCATICYVIYNGLGWPGISTAFFTVYFTGLSTTGTTNRKLLFRLIGSTIGGLVLGIGCLVFVFPNLEGVQGFLLVIAVVSLLGAWIAGSPYFGYIGLQTVFSFNLLAFEGLRAPDQMTPARDRLLGIALGFLVMLIIFHQVRPARSVDTMRQLLARLLRVQAELVRLLGMPPATATVAKTVAVRQQIATLVANLHNFAHAVQFEFPPDRAADMKLSEELLHAARISGDLLFGVGGWPPAVAGGEDRALLAGLRDSIADSLRGLASMLVRGPQAREEDSPAIPARSEIVLERELPPYAARAIADLRELQMACDGLVDAEEDPSPAQQKEEPDERA